MNYNRQRSVAALRPGDRIMVGDSPGQILPANLPQLTEFVVTSARPGLVEAEAADGTSLDIGFERNAHGELRFADHRIARSIRWTIPLPVGPAEAVRAYAEVLCAGGREAILLHLGTFRDGVAEARLVERREAAILPGAHGPADEGDWSGTLCGNGAFWDRPLLVSTQSLPPDAATGDLVGAPGFNGHVEGGVPLIDLARARRIGAFADIDAIGAFLPAPLASMADESGRPLSGSVLCGPAGHHEALLEIERAVARTQPDEVLALWIDGGCSVLARTGIVFHNLDDAADHFHRDALGDGLYVFEDARWWTHTSYEGEHDAGIDGTWRAATPDDAARFGFADAGALDAEVDGHYDLTEGGRIPVAGLALRLMGQAQAGLEREAVPALSA